MSFTSTVFSDHFNYQRDSLNIEFIVYQTILSLIAEGKKSEARIILEDAIKVIYDPALLKIALGYLDEDKPIINMKTNKDLISESITTLEKPKDSHDNSNHVGFIRKIWDILVSIYQSIIRLICMSAPHTEFSRQGLIPNEAIEFDRLNKIALSDHYDNSSTIIISKQIEIKPASTISSVQPSKISQVNSLDKITTPVLPYEESTSISTLKLKI